MKNGEESDHVEINIWLEKENQGNPKNVCAHSTHLCIHISHLGTKQNMKECVSFIMD